MATAWLPLALAPVLVHLIAEGRIDLGGGEKDLVWILPWLLWSLLFGGSAMFLWWRRWSLSRSLARSAAIAIAGVLVAMGVLAILGQLGIAGRF